MGLSTNLPGWRWAQASTLLRAQFYNRLQPHWLAGRLFAGRIPMTVNTVLRTIVLEETLLAHEGLSRARQAGMAVVMDR
jgi:hypothetical protein